MASNYPPGVSGNEPEIAGYPDCGRPECGHAEEDHEATEDGGACVICECPTYLQDREEDPPIADPTYGEVVGVDPRLTLLADAGDVDALVDGLLDPRALEPAAEPSVARDGGAGPAVGE